MAIYCKTPLGVDAIEKRTPPLPLRNRQILIMLDGRRDAAELEKAFGAEAVAAVLQALLDAGLIETGTAPSPAAEPSPITASAPALSAEDEARLVNARNLMVNSTLSFAGNVGKPLAQRLRDATTLAELQALRDEWHRMIAQNPMALSHLQTIEKQLGRLFE